MSTINKVSPLLGESFAMEELRDFIVGVSILRDPILLTGERGTGKGLAASKVHAVGRNAGAPHTQVTCSRFDEDELEMLFFGGESEESTGILCSPHVGTCYVAQIEALSPEMSRRFAKHLSRGATQAHSISPRLIFGSSRELSDLYEEKRLDHAFLELASRYHMRIPPLHERCEDIPILCNYHIWLNSPSDDYEGRWEDFRTFVLPDLLTYAWPGNVSELIEVVNTYCGLSEQPQRASEMSGSPTSPDAYYLKNVFREMYRDLLEVLVIEKLCKNPFFLLGSPAKLEEGRYAR